MLVRSGHKSPFLVLVGAKGCSGLGKTVLPTIEGFTITQAAVDFLPPGI